MKNYFKRIEPKNIILKIIFRIVFSILAFIVSLYLLTFTLFGIGWFIGLIFITPKPNPTERNYITFPNTNKDRVFDSLYKFMEIIKTYPFPLASNKSYSLMFDHSLDYEYREFKLNDTLVGEYTFPDIKKSKQFKDFTNEQIEEFLLLYKFLYNRGIYFGVYDKEFDYFRFDYKDLYLMYDSPTFPDDVYRFLEYYGGKKNQFPNWAHKMPLDYYRGFYLTCNNQDTTSKDVPYKILDKFIKK